MRVIIGLGNPGKDYQRTRHNIGFEIIDQLATGLVGAGKRSRFKAELTEGSLGGERTVLAKPQMYMNLSGIPTRELVNWYKISLDHLLVIYDDMDLPLGQLRLRGEGTAGGHNGMKSIIAELGSNSFPRLRIGIGRGGGSSIAHVLSRFTAEEEARMNDARDQAVAAVRLWMSDSLVGAMNIVNQSAPAPIANGETPG